MTATQLTMTDEAKVGRLPKGDMAFTFRELKAFASGSRASMTRSLPPKRAEE